MIGRLADLHYLDGSGSTLQRFEYGHRSSGDRLYARVEQSGEVNTRSWVYTHDALGRLASAERGELTFDSGGVASIGHSAALPPRRVSWGLDSLGNWTEGAGSSGGGGFFESGRVEEEDAAGDGYGPEDLVLSRQQVADLRNRLASVVEDSGGGNPVASVFAHDASGNLVADDAYWYQYDAFNRLSSVHLKGSLHFDAAGAPESGTPGAWRASLAYDALGRLASVQTPWLSGTDHRKSWLYYDGVRRVMEVFKDPAPGLGGPVAGGGGAQQYTTYTDREYVWGPDNVDECLWQVSKVGEVMHVLQDASMDVAATLNGSGAVTRQYAFDPYGELIAEESFGSPAHNRLGHHGLFFDRLDAGAPGASLAAGARGVYHARNRSYDPRLGRFTSADPNGTGAAVLAHAFGGSDASSDLSALDALAMYGDGMSLYAALGSSPLGNRDPLGLWMWGDWTDTLLKGAEAAGLAAAVVETYQFVQEEGVDWALDWDRPDDEYRDLFEIARAVSGNTDAEVDSAAEQYAPLIRGSLFTTPKALAAFAKATKRVQKLFAKWLDRGPKNVHVYVTTRNGRPYVGITNDVNRRAKEHGVDRLKSLNPTKPMTRNQARAVENRIIKNNPGFDNEIQSVSDRHRFAEWAELWGEEAMKRLRIPLRPKP